MAKNKVAPFFPEHSVVRMNNVRSTRRLQYAVSVTFIRAYTRMMFALISTDLSVSNECREPTVKSIRESTAYRSV